MSYCSHCGGKTEPRVPEGEDRERAVCTSCGRIHYENPRMVVGCIVEHEQRILLCRRAIEPRHGYWTVPAGFLELGESAAQGAVRETHEEAGARVEVVAPYCHFDIPQIGQAYIFYRARFVTPEHSAGPESLETRLVTASEIPWGELAFPVVRVSLQLHADDLRAGSFRMHHGVITREPSGRFELRDHLALGAR